MISESRKCYFAVSFLHYHRNISSFHVALFLYTCKNQTLWVEQQNTNVKVVQVPSLLRFFFFLPKNTRTPSGVCLLCYTKQSVSGDVHTNDQDFDESEALWQENRQLKDKLSKLKTMIQSLQQRNHGTKITIGPFSLNFPSKIPTECSAQLFPLLQPALK